MQRAVTVKLVRPEWAESEEFRGRFATAMRKMSTLSNQHIATVYDWGEEEVGKRTTVYAVVEHLSGGSLRDLFDRGRYLDPSQALVVGLEACRGLDYAHREGLVHTELTPAKLVFGDDRRLRIVDFGLAQLLGAEDWSEPATVATHVARYSSPEQALAKPLDGKTDVYSLALILVEAVTGKVPFAERSTVATLSARVGRLMPASADLGQLAAVLEKAGRPDPADRSTAAELGRSSGPCRRDTAPPEADPDPRHGTVRRRPQPDAPAQRPHRGHRPSATTLRRQRCWPPPPSPRRPRSGPPTPRSSPLASPVPEAATRCRRPPNRRPPPCCTTAMPTAPRTSSPSWAARSPRSRRHLPWRRPAPAPDAAPRPTPRQRGRRRRWLPWVIALAVLAALAGLAWSPATVRGADAPGAGVGRSRRSGGARADGRVRLGHRHPDRAQRRAARRRGDHPHRTGRRRGARRGRAVPRHRERGPGVPPASRTRQPDPCRGGDGARRAEPRRPPRHRAA